MSSSTALIRKLIAVLESIEKLPVYSYDSPGAGYGLQVATASFSQIFFCTHISLFFDQNVFENHVLFLS